MIDLENNEQNFGVKVLKNAIMQPAIVVMNNAGLNGKYIAQKIINNYENVNFGYDLNQSSLFSYLFQNNFKFS